MWRKSSAEVKERPGNLPYARQKVNGGGGEERSQAVFSSTANERDLPIDDMKGRKGNERSQDESLLGFWLELRGWE